MEASGKAFPHTLCLQASGPVPSASTNRERGEVESLLPDRFSSHHQRLGEAPLARALPKAKSGITRQCREEHAL